MHRKNRPGVSLSRFSPELQQRIAVQFVQAMAWTTNATEAIVAALPPTIAAKISRASAANRAHQLLAKAEIREAIIRERRKSAARHKALADQVIMERAAIAFSRISNVTSLEDGKLKVRDYKDMPPQEIAAIKSIESRKTVNKDKVDEIIKVEFWDKHRALDALQELFGLTHATLPAPPVTVQLASASDDLPEGAVPPAPLNPDLLDDEEPAQGEAVEQFAVSAVDIWGDMDGWGEEAEDDEEYADTADPTAPLQI